MKVSIRRPRVAVVSDLAEERWHSMDLVAEILMLGLRSPGHAPRRADADSARRWFAGSRGFPGSGRLSHAATADRIINRVWDYPSIAQRARRRLRPLSHRRSQLRASGHRAAARPLARDVPRSRRFRGGPARHRGAVGGRAPAGAAAVDGSVGRGERSCVAVRQRVMRSSHPVSFDASRVAVVPYGVHPSCTPQTGCAR